MTGRTSPLRAAVVYESMYGNTHAVAAAIALGLDPSGRVPVIPVTLADRDLLERLDLVVVGGPTHGHGMTRPNTRKAAVDAAAKAGRLLAGDAPGPDAGMREWLDELSPHPVMAAAFDTRMRAPSFLTGRASVGIGRRLRRAGGAAILPPCSFFVTRDETLAEGEEERARNWGAQLAALAAARLQAA